MIKDGRQARRGMTSVRVVLAISVQLVVATILFGPISASAHTANATRGGYIVESTINIPALVVDNLCNGDVVNLSGDEHLVVATTPRPDGGYTVRSSMRALDLQGERIFPLPSIDYTGDDASNTYEYFAPAGSSTHRVVHWTELVPQGNAPTMWLVLVIKETFAADGAPLVSVERAYLTCREPCRD